MSVPLACDVVLCWIAWNVCVVQDGPFRPVCKTVWVAAVCTVDVGVCCCAIWTYPCYDIVIYVDICTVVVGGELLCWKGVGVGADAALAFPLLSFALPFAFGFRMPSVQYQDVSA